MRFTQIISAAALVSCTTAAVAEAPGQSARSALRIYATIYKHVEYEGQRFDISKLVSCVTVPESLRGETSSFKIHDSRISCSFYSDTQCRNELVADVEEDEPDLREIGAHDNLDSVKCREK